MSKNCPECGKFMALTDLLPQDDEFDYELAVECGFDERNDSEFDDKWQAFRYVQDQWECDSCGISIWHVEGLRYYYEPESNSYQKTAKPFTPQELAIRERLEQEAAGQPRMFEEEDDYDTP